MSIACLVRFSYLLALPSKKPTRVSPRMDRPMLNMFRSLTIQNLIQFGGKLGNNGGWYLAHQHHIETKVANVPGDLVGALGYYRRGKALQFNSDGCADTRLAEQPSAKIRKESICSRSFVSCK